MALAFVAPIVSKIGEYLAPEVGRQFGYLIFYKRNIENLKEQVRKLEDKRVGTQLLFSEANRKREIIPGVELWLNKVDDLDKEAQKFLEDEVKANKGCLNGWCPNLKSRYSLSRKAAKMTQDMVEICAEENLPRVSYPAPPVEITFTSTEGFKAFESRRSIMNKVMEALADDSINMIGICGMGGVGKTIMVNEVAKKAKENKLFGKIAMTVVSQKPDLIKIQGEIAEQLGFGSFVGNNLLVRASDLRQRILNIEKVLVILDDVWERLELNEIGIPFGNDHKGCKIVLTSRSEDVSNDMGTQKKITVQVLHEEEAWNLFKEMAGISSYLISTTTDLHSTQKAVAKECGGLPIAIVTVGKALNGKDKPSWDYALKQLQKSIGKNIKGVHPKVFQSLEFSYNYLESEEAKKFFLLCSLFPEDYRIPIEDLVRYGIGLKLFEGIDIVGDARNRVHALVDDLMKCYLLMGNEKGVSIKMHDVIRDVAISIASRKEYSFMVRCDEALGEWLEEDRHKNYTAISLRCTRMDGLPNNLELPSLNLLRLEYKRELPKTPDCFYQGMKELKVVALSNMAVQSLPASLQCLTNLRTLSLHHCKFSGDISVIGALKNLEILSFTYYSAMEELPKEIAHLTRLKLLDLIRCKVERISPGVLSSLSRLEELYVGNNVRRWNVPSLSRLEEEEEDEQEIISDAAATSITELAYLSNLVALDIHIPHWPNDFVLGKVRKFNISVGGDPFPWFDFSYLLKNQLRLSGVDASDVMKSGTKMLLKSTEFLELSVIAGLKNIPCDSYKDIFEYLKKLSVKYCRDLEYLINPTTEDDDGVAPQRVFPVLEDLFLEELDNFKGIICGSWQQLSKKKKEVELQNLPQIPHHNKKSGPTQLDWLRNLTSVEMRRCDMIESMFSLSMARGLVQLQTLDIDECKMMESIVCSSEGGGEHEKTIAVANPIEFPKLQKLTLWNLPSIIAFCKAVNAIKLPQLNELDLGSIPKLRNLCHPPSESNCNTIIRPLFDKIGGPTQLDWLCNLTSVNMHECDMVESLFALSMARDLVQLRTLDIFGCKMMESIVSSGEGGGGGEGEHEITIAATDHIEFPKLQQLYLENLPSLIAFCKVVNAIELPQLNKLTLFNIPKLRSLCYSTSESNYATIIRPLFDKIGGPRQLDRFCNLTTVQIRKSGMVESLFDLSMARGLVQLRTLDIFWCKMMESIVSSSERGGEHEKTTAAIDPIEFPKLQKLDLCILPSFIAFSKAVNAIELPQLNELNLSHIPKLKSLYHSASESNYDIIIRPLFDKKSGPTQLDWLRNLTSIKMESCDMIESMFSLSMARGLVQLQTLDIDECKMIESIVCSSEGGREHEITAAIEFPKLQKLTLKKLPSFIAFCKAVNAIELPQLNELDLTDIPKLRSLRHNASESNCDTIIRPLFDKKSGPTQLDWLRNLTSVKMRRCGMVESMFSLSMARGLVQLQTLYIDECEMMESIVCSSEGGREHEITAAEDPIEFPKLQKLTLTNLPSFIAFCKVVNAIELPQLNKLDLTDIPKLKSLYHTTSESNCDTIIQPLFNKGGQLTSIEKLFLSGMENLIEIWPRELKAKLKEMRVGMCHRLLSILFPSNLIECLQNLELLEVKECRSVEVAFDFGGLIVREGHPVVALLSLKYLKLIHLPKLTHVWMNKNSPTEGIQGFNNLTSLTVKRCGSLRNLFSSSSVAKLLVQLQELEITECVAMEAIIAKEQGVDDDDDEVTTTTTTNTIIMFPQLTSLKLSALPNLISFCPQGYTFEGSLLKKVQVINCPKMESLPSQFQKIQALQRSNERFHEAIQKTDKAPRKFMLTNEGEFTIMEIDDATELWQNQLEAECLHDVIRMWVQCCGKLSSVVSTSLIQKFHNLKQLKVWWCYSVGVIFDLEGVFADEGTVTQLSEMEFKYLPKLTDIWKINFPQQTHCFQNLRFLKVKRCDSLKYIFTLSMAKVLVNLESLNVGHCEKVEKIVTKEEEEEEEEEGRTILPKLREWCSVTLKDLPSLMTFGVPFESEYLILQSCPKFEDD